MKRALALGLSLILVLALLPLAASASRGSMTEEEKAIFTELRTPTPTGDGQFVLPEKNITFAENYLLSETDEPLRQDQIDEIMSYIADAKAAVKEAGTGEVKQWSFETRERIRVDIQKAVDVLDKGLVVTGHAAEEHAEGDQHGYGSITISDAAGNVILSEDELIIKKTGSDYMAFAVAGLCGLTVLCACAFVSKKVELF